MRRMSRLFCIAAPLVVCFGWPAGQVAFARGRPRPFRTTGLVRTTQAEGGKVTAVTILDDGGKTYRVVLDKKGLALGRQMDWQKTRATGKVEVKDGENWLTLRGFDGMEMIAAHEQWRRMRCNYCVVGPALVNATEPPQLSGAKCIDGRPYSFKRQIIAWTRDDRFLWAATDSALLQVDLAKKQLIRTYSVSDGLPDTFSYGLLSDGKTLWILHQHGVAALNIAQARLVDLPALKCNYATITKGKDCVWVVSDKGTFKLTGTDHKPVAQPPPPTAARITKTVQKGIWFPFWKRKTSHLLADLASVDDHLFVSSYGDIYQFDGAKWAQLARNGWGLAGGGGRVWFLSSKGVSDYQVKAKKLTLHAKPQIPEGLCQKLLVTPHAAWVALEPRTSPAGPLGGGLARFDLADGKWQTWPKVNDRSVGHVTCLLQTDDAVWAVANEGVYKNKPAHPGMTYVKRKVFEAEQLCLHRHGRATKTWATTPLGRPTFEKRLIIGQDGARGHDVVVPQTVDLLSVGPRRVFGAVQLFPKTYFCGYYPSVEQLATAKDKAWTATFDHRPQDLGLQGEQPLVLNISNTGRMVLEAVGHDNILGLFLDRDKHWTVTEGRISRFEAKAGKWVTVAEPGFRFYWRATAALDDGRSVYIGSDRGLISRLDPATGRFELLAVLRQRAITGLAKDENGRLIVASRPAPLGILPVQLRGKLDHKEWTCARFDGETWEPVDAKAMPKTLRPPWFVKRIKKRHRWDKSRGNFLFGPTPNGPKPKLYVKGVFYPRFLCTSPDRSRMWISVHSGLLRLDNLATILQQAP